MTNVSGSEQLQVVDSVDSRLMFSIMDLQLMNSVLGHRAGGSQEAVYQNG